MSDVLRESVSAPDTRRAGVRRDRSTPGRTRSRPHRVKPTHTMTAPFVPFSEMSQIAGLLSTSMTSGTVACEGDPEAV